MKSMQVKKRNGRLENFNVDKINSSASCKWGCSRTEQ